MEARLASQVISASVKTLKSVLYATATRARSAAACRDVLVVNQALDGFDGNADVKQQRCRRPAHKLG